MPSHINVLENQERRILKTVKWKRNLIISISLILIFIVIIIFYYGSRIYKINQAYRQLYDIRAEIGLRKFPYPFKAALTIASDIDETKNVDKFLEIQEFLNTKNITAMGKGVGRKLAIVFLCLSDQIIRIIFHILRVGTMIKE